MLIKQYGNWSYVAVGVMETVKGVLAFLACPVLGKLSDRVGRKPCLLFSVIGITFDYFAPMRNKNGQCNMFRNDNALLGHGIYGQRVGIFR